MALSRISCLFSLILCQFLCCYPLAGLSTSSSSPPNTFTISSYSYRENKLRPYDLRYIRGLCFYEFDQYALPAADDQCPFGLLGSWMLTLTFALKVLIFSFRFQLSYLCKYSAFVVCSVPRGRLLSDCPAAFWSLIDAEHPFR